MIYLLLLWFYRLDMILTLLTVSQYFSHNDFGSSMVTLQKSSYINIPVSFSFFAFWRIFCLSLKRRNLQTIVRGRDLLRFPKRWHRSISMLPSISNLLKRTSCAFRSSHVSLGSSVRPSKRQDLSSNSISFFDTSFGSKRWSSSTCRSDFILEMSFFTIASSSSSLACVNAKLFAISRNSFDILSRRSLVFCN